MGEIDVQCLSGAENLFDSMERVRPSFVVGHVRKSTMLALACTIIVAMSGRKRNNPNNAACGDDLVEEFLNRPDFVD